MNQMVQYSNGVSGLGPNNVKVPAALGGLSIAACFQIKIKNSTESQKKDRLVSPKDHNDIWGLTKFKVLDVVCYELSKTKWLEM